MSATQPPSSPPPTIVVTSSINFNSQTDPCACITSRMPPCNMMTARAMVAPTRNHHRKTFTDVITPLSSKFHTPVQTTILNGFGYMDWVDSFRTGQIGNCSGDPQDAPMGASRQAQPGHGLFQQLLRCSVEPTIPLQEPRLQLGICVNAVPGIASRLPVPGFKHSRPNAARGFRSRTVIMKFAHRHRGDFDVDIDAVLQRPG